MRRKREEVRALFSALKSLARKGHFSLVISPKGQVKIEWGEEILKEKLGFLPPSIPPDPPVSLHLCSHRQFQAWWRKLLEGKSAVSDFCFFKGKNKEIWVRAFGHPHLDKKEQRIKRITGFLQNVTREKSSRCF